jgi:hypothetical protein
MTDYITNLAARALGIGMLRPRPPSQFDSGPLLVVDAETPAPPRHPPLLPSSRTNAVRPRASALRTEPMPNGQPTHHPRRVESPPKGDASMSEESVDDLNSSIASRTRADKSLEPDLRAPSAPRTVRPPELFRTPSGVVAESTPGPERAQTTPSVRPQETPTNPPAVIAEPPPSPPTSASSPPPSRVTETRRHESNAITDHPSLHKVKFVDAATGVPTHRVEVKPARQGMDATRPVEDPGKDRSTRISSFPGALDLNDGVPATLVPTSIAQRRATTCPARTEIAEPRRTIATAPRIGSDPEPARPIRRRSTVGVSSGSARSDSFHSPGSTLADPKNPKRSPAGVKDDLCLSTDTRSFRAAEHGPGDDGGRSPRPQNVSPHSVPSPTAKGAASTDILPIRNTESVGTNPILTADSVPGFEPTKSTLVHHTSKHSPVEPTRSRQAATSPPPPPTVVVSIGKLEVHDGPPAPAPLPRRRPTPTGAVAMKLDNYLRRRTGEAGDE